MGTEETATIRLDHEQCLMTVEMKGAVTDSGLIALFGRARAMPEFCKWRYRILVDARGLTEVSLTAEIMSSLARHTQEDQNRIALLVSNWEIYGMARMYELIAGAKVDRISVFREKEAALQFLEVSG